MSIRRLLLPENLQHSEESFFSRYFDMRGVLPALGLSIVLMQPALAQGIKDPPNYPMSASQRAKAQATQSASRPTTIRNVATGSLPAGMAVQRVYRDGKLVALPRY